MVPFTQGMLEEPVSGGREGEVSLGYFMPLRQPSRDTISQMSFLNPRKFGLEIWIWQSSVYIDLN